MNIISLNFVNSMRWPIFVLAFFSPLKAYTAIEILTIDDAVDIGLRNAFNILIASAQVEKARQFVYETKANFNPTITLTGTYTRNTRAITEPLSFAGGAVTSSTATTTGGGAGGSIGSSGDPSSGSGDSVDVGGGRNLCVFGPGTSAGVNFCPGGYLNPSTASPSGSSSSSGSGTSSGSTASANSCCSSCISTSGANQLVVLEPTDLFASSLNITIPIDLFRMNLQAVYSAIDLRDAAYQNFLATVNNTKFNIRSAYYNVLQAEAQLQVAEEAHERSKTNLEVNQRLYEAGSVAKIDVLRGEADFQKSRADLVNAENSLIIARKTLNNLLARPIDTEFKTVDITTLPRPASDFEKWQNLALQIRPEAKAQQYNISSAEYTAKYERKSVTPSLKLSGTYNQIYTKNPGFGVLPTVAFGTVELTIPIYDGGVSRARVKEALEDVRQGVYQLEQTNLGICLDVQQTLIKLDNARQIIDAAQKAYEANLEAYNIALIRYRAGVAIQLDLLTAQNDLTNAKNALVIARYTYLSNYADLQRAIAEDDLESFEFSTVQGVKERWRPESFKVPLPSRRGITEKQLESIVAFPSVGNAEEKDVHKEEEPIKGLLKNPVP